MSILSGVSGPTRSSAPAGKTVPSKSIRAKTPRSRAKSNEEDLAAQCRREAARLRPRLDGLGVVVHEPFVIAGDLPVPELSRWHERTIGPASRAIAKEYTSIEPDKPITIYLFSAEESYRRWARRLYGDRAVSKYGYYKPGQRAMLMNIATGGGTLVHELTHALVDFDFPDIPDWFNEGLASLHEQCRFRADESGIVGLVNWRLPALQQAIRAGRLRPLESLVSDDDFRGRDEGLNYAHARYFCMYMQHRGLLPKFYRRFRGTAARGPHGAQAVTEVFAGESWDKLNADFRRWAMTLKTAR